MKVIITESKFDNATQSYLTMLFGGMQVEKSTPLPGRDVYFYDDITEPVFVLFNKKELYLYEEYARQIFNMFSMKSWEEIEEIILKWFRNHYKIKVDYLYTFDDPEHTYSM
jgi:hypothetical protein